MQGVNLEFRAGCFAPSELQWLADAPPGKGMAVVYVGVCRPTGELYVGKHIHGLSGRSVRSARWKTHESNQNCVRLHRSIVKYGKHAFDWTILEHVVESVVCAREAYYISSEGLDTLSPKGLNLRSEDHGVPWSDEARARLSAATKIAQNRPTVKEAKRKRVTEWLSDPDVREAHVNRCVERWNGTNAVENRRAASDRAKEWVTPEVKKKMSDSAKNRLLADPDHLKRMADARDDTAWKAKLSTSAIARFAIPENRKAQSKTTRAALSTDSARANMRLAGQRRRQVELDACSTEAERDKLRSEFKKRDKRNAIVARSRAKTGPRLRWK